MSSRLLHELTDAALIQAIRGQRARARRAPQAFTKAALVGKLSHLPSLRLQRVAGVIVRRLWPTFREA